MAILKTRTEGSKVDIGTEILKEDGTYMELVRDKELNKSKKIEMKRKHLEDNYQYLVDLPPSCLPEEHKAKLGGGLRCFRLVAKRNEDGNKIKGSTKRCGNPSVKGSFFCKKHGGANTHNLVHGKMRNPMLSIYRGSFNNELGDLLELFVNDRDIMDVKPELIALRVALNQYVEKLANAKPVNAKMFVREMRKITSDEEMTNLEKFVMMKELFDNVATLTDGDSIDRIARTVESISRVIERIHKMQTRDDFMLTKEGLRIMLRAIVDAFNDVVEDEDKRKNLREALLAISVQTGGDISRYQKNEVIDIDHEVIE